MKKAFYRIWVMCALCIVCACSKEEVPLFDSATGINFLAPDGKGGFDDNYLNLSGEINLYQSYMTGMDVQSKELVVGFQLEGLVAGKDMKVRFGLEAVDNYGMAQIDLPADSVIRAGEYLQTATFVCNRPLEYDKVYAAYIVFDYANSDVVAGTKERQKFMVVVKDYTDWAGMFVNGKDDWNKLYGSVLGEYGPVKVRFILYALAKQGASYASICNRYYYTPYYPSYGLQKKISYLKSELDAYNAAAGKPLCEPDGTPVSFN